MTVLDVADWAMDAAPYVPAVVIPSVLGAAVYGAWHGTRRIRQRRRDRRETDAIRRLGDRLHHEPLRLTRPGPDDHERRQLEQLYAMPAWKEDR